MSLRLALGQINCRVGDVTGNCARVIEGIERARGANVDIVVFPELAIPGYPPEDLLFRASFVRAAAAALEKVVEACGDITVVVGTIHDDGMLRNAAAVIHDARLIGLEYKQRLPNYGVFDENRYFVPGTTVRVYQRGGVSFGVTICEDMWYPNGPYCDQVTGGGASLLINLSASPYHLLKGRQRERMLGTRASDTASYVAYCNLVGGQDELVFDGQSVVLDPSGLPIARAKQFEEDLLLCDVDLESLRQFRQTTPNIGRPAGGLPSAAAPVVRVQLPQSPPVYRSGMPPRIEPQLSAVAEAHSALVLGVRDYVGKTGFKSVVLGLSGGIDSSVVAALAVEALGPGSVTVVAMPTRYSSAESLDDAKELATNLDITLVELPIDDVFQASLDALSPLFAGRPADLTEENLQSRIRGNMLMAISNKFGSLVLTTGNKSEVSVGYSTLYGDSAGGFAVIKDVPKTLVYQIAAHINDRAGKSIIPRRVLEKAPSAELRPDQKDTDSLPEYSVLDPILRAYIEDNTPAGVIVASGFDAATVKRTVGLVDRSEYKRRQSPPGVKISGRAFGRDWRLPISNAFSDTEAV
jgi:NAD+ synthase (glutamine-hydrolysing)